MTPRLWAGDELPDVSVIVPAYNAEATLAECLDSLLELDYPKEKLQLICVDNTSTDATVAIIRRYGENVRLLHEEKRGPAEARNTGICAASGEVVALTDSDCVADRQWLRNIVEPLQNRCIGVVGGRIVARPDGNAVEQFGEQIHDHYRAIHVFRPAYVITMNWASRTSVLREVGLFDGRFLRGEDVDLSYRILQAGYQFAYQPDAIVRHRNRSTFFGLFAEGYVHGFHAVLVNSVHRGFLGQFAYRRLSFDRYRKIASGFRSAILGPRSTSSVCWTIFDVGKSVGKLVGSARFRYLDL